MKHLLFSLVMLVGCIPANSTTSPNVKKTFQLGTCLISEERLNIVFTDPDQARKNLSMYNRKLSKIGQKIRDGESLVNDDLDIIIEVSELHKAIRDCIPR